MSKTTSFDFKCPSCGAQPGKRCIDSSGQIRPKSHNARLDLAAKKVRNDLKKGIAQIMRKQSGA